MILKEKQEINFRKMKKLMKNLRKYLKIYCRLHLEKKNFTQAGDGNNFFSLAQQSFVLPYQSRLPNNHQSLEYTTSCL